MRRVAALLALAVASSCGGDPPVTPPAAPISVTFVNHLRYPVTVSAANGSGTLVTASTTIVFPGATTAVNWSEQDEMFSDGTAIPDDLGTTSILVADKATLTISNVVGTITYFEPYVDNSTGQSIVIAIAHGTEVRCIGTQSAGSTGVRWGYYRLDAQTEFRYYKPGTACTGSYRAWPATTISSAMFGGGTVVLNADLPP